MGRGIGTSLVRSLACSLHRRAGGRAIEGMVRGRKTRGKRQGRTCKGTMQVILGIGMAAREARAPEAQDICDLVDRDAAAEQALGNPQIGGAPIGRRETLRNLQAMQPAGIDGDGSGRREGAGRSGRRARRRRQRQKAWRGLRQSGGVSSEWGSGVNQFDPGSIAGLAARGFLIGEAREPSAMTPVRTSVVCTVESRQMLGDRGRQVRNERSLAHTDPGLQMAGAGAQHDTWFMPVAAHTVEDLVVGTIQIHENVASVAVACEGVEEDVVSFAIAQSEEGHGGAACQLNCGPNAIARKWFAAVAMNQTELIIVARHGRQLSAHGIEGNEESAIHDRDSNIGFGSPWSKGEVLTLQKRGSFHFALTNRLNRLDMSKSL